MHSLKYRIETRSPVVISKISGDANMVATQEYIPGSTVLGVLARHFISERHAGRPAHEYDEFYKWFLLGELKIGNAYVLSQDEYGEHSHFPTPLSIEKEKYDTGVYDLLFHDQQPDNRKERVGDFCYLQNGSLYRKTVETTINFHHQRNRTTGTSEEGKIFNYEAIAAGQIFGGTICGTQDDLQSLLNICSDEWPVFIGRSKNAQYGAIKFEFVDKAPVCLQSQVVWPTQEKKETGEEEPAQSISMTLVSDLILYNECGFPTTDAEDLQKALQRYLGEVRIKKAFIRKNEVEHFVSIWRLKKPSETCFSAGSTFLLEMAREEVSRLAAIQQTGIGERTHEGFGRCVFALQIPKYDDLSLRNEDEDEAGRKTRKPPGDVPEEVRRIITAIVQRIIRERVALDAINQQGNFNYLPSNALIGRLQALAESAHERRDFVAELNNLRDIALRQLRRCISSDSSLLEYLASFRLGQSSLTGLANTGLEPEWIAAMEKLGQGKEFTLFDNLAHAIKKKSDDLKKYREEVLRHVEFCHNPFDWEAFSRKPWNNDIKRLCDEIDFKPEDASGFVRELNRIFYTTFFAEMRKRKIASDSAA